MKCPICNGSGIDNRCDRLSCYECGGSGEIEQTNEEWIRQCTTEELANVLAIQKCDGCNDEPYDEEYAVCKYCMETKKRWVLEWLKEVHQ